MLEIADVQRLDIPIDLEDRTRLELIGPANPVVVSRNPDWSNRSVLANAIRRIERERKDQPLWNAGNEMAATANWTSYMDHSY